MFMFSDSAVQAAAAIDMAASIIDAVECGMRFSSIDTGLVSLWCGATYLIDEARRAVIVHSDFGLDRINYEHADGTFDMLVEAVSAAMGL